MRKQIYDELKKKNLLIEGASWYGPVADYHYGVHPNMPPTDKGRNGFELKKAMFRNNPELERQFFRLLRLVLDTKITNLGGLGNSFTLVDGQLYLFPYNMAIGTKFGMFHSLLGVWEDKTKKVPFSIISSGDVHNLAYHSGQIDGRKEMKEILDKYREQLLLPPIIRPPPQDEDNRRIAEEAAAKVVIPGDPEVDAAVADFYSDPSEKELLGVMEADTNPKLQSKVWTVVNPDQSDFEDEGFVAFHDRLRQKEQDEEEDSGEEEESQSPSRKRDRDGKDEEQEKEEDEEEEVDERTRFESILKLLCKNRVEYDVNLRFPDGRRFVYVRKFYGAFLRVVSTEKNGIFHHQLVRDEETGQYVVGPLIESLEQVENVPFPIGADQFLEYAKKTGFHVHQELAFYGVQSSVEGGIEWKSLKKDGERWVEE